MPDIPTSWLTLLGIIASTILVWNGIRASRVDSQINENVKTAEAHASQNPDKAGPAWALARVTLEKYFNRNLNQIKWIFIVAVFVMLAGFLVILYGVGLSIRASASPEPSRLAALSGIVTEFIGATFIWVYRSTMRQASDFIAVLERINTVGMAVQILDSIPEHERELKNKTKARLVETLIALPATASRDSQGSGEPEVKKGRRPKPKDGETGKDAAESNG